MFSTAIEEALQLRYEHLKGLKGLRVRDMKILNANSQLDSANHSSV
jgi:hypothetical protein